MLRNSLQPVSSGATTPEQVRQNAAAGSVFVPAAEQNAQIEALFPVPRA
ncbi:hypothetical protein ACXR2T_11040 [Leucobacter sp. HY1910]